MPTIADDPPLTLHPTAGPDQAQRDHRVFVQAVRQGRIKAIIEAA